MAGDKLTSAGWGLKRIEPEQGVKSHDQYANDVNAHKDQVAVDAAKAVLAAGGSQSEAWRAAEAALGCAKAGYPL